MWAAHLLYHFAIGWKAAWPVLERAITGTILIVFRTRCDSGLAYVGTATDRSMPDCCSRYM